MATLRDLVLEVQEAAVVETPGDLRRAIAQEQQIREWERAFPR